MLFVYTRHGFLKTKDGIVERCPKSDDKNWKRCRCPKWIDGTLPGRSGRCRQSAGTRSWEKAEERRKELEDAAAAGKDPSPRAARRVTVSEAVASFMKDAANRELSEETLAKKKTWFVNQLAPWCLEHGYKHIDQLDLQAVEDWRGTWKNTGLSKAKKQEGVSGFFAYCVNHDWINGSPMKGISPIAAPDHAETDYFPPEEFDAIIDATYLYQSGRWDSQDQHAVRIRTLTLLMRWSGLRIGDALSLRRDRVRDGKLLLLRQRKTKHPVCVPLPDEVLKALEELPPGCNAHPAYYFWTGRQKVRNAVKSWARSYKKLFALAADKLPIDPETGQTKRCHAHMFRDTFAVEMLLAGVPLEQVSLLLGHKSIKITEKHYSPWVRARQEQLEANVRQAWPQKKVKTKAA